MNTYFTQSNIMKRFFFVVGKTKDTFVNEALEAFDLEFSLQDHLKKLGYERIMFYSKTQKIYCFDECSYALSASRSVTPAQSSKKPSLIKGPLGGKLLNKAPTNVPSSDALPDSLNFGKMNDLDAFQRIDYCMHDKSHKTAVIFNNAEDFMTFFGEVRTDRGSETIRSKIYDSINDYDGLDYDNSNIMVFVFPQRSLSETMSLYGNMSGLWRLFFQPKMGKGNVIEIDSPAQAEIRNAINLIRIKHGLQVDFRDMENISKLFAKTAYANGLTMTELMRQMMVCADSGRTLNMDTAEQICGKRIQKSAFERLDELVGMESIKQQIRAFIMRSKQMAAAVEQGYISRIQPQPKQGTAGMNLHFVLTGNPGTGKTTVARLLGEIYYELGFLPGGHTVKVTRSDLVAGYVGQTAIKTRACIDKAIGGVLFVDEAYMLKRPREDGMSDNDFGQEAIDTILEAMSDRAGEFAVVVAGYPKEMEGFLNSNPGLQRRFNQILHIEDYSPEELHEIFDRYCRKKKYTVDEALSAGLNNFFVNWHRSRDKNWGNAGNVEKLLDNMYEHWCMRAGQRDSSGNILLSQCDVPASLQVHFKDISEAKQDAITQLNNLIGLDNVKDRIKKLRRNILIGGHTSEPGHYVFAGNPGTGKTTVARLLGDLLCEAGVLRRGHVIEVGREDLVGIHVGTTAAKTKAVIESAIDGVLFIDEAYRLVDGGDGSSNNFGLEAIDTLVAAMENHRDRLCVICAGYTRPMEEFVQSNPGLKSRFTEVIEFGDYNAAELLQILRSFAGRDNVLEKEFLDGSLRIFEHWATHRSVEFGNARDVRKYFSECTDTLYERIEQEYGLVNIPEKAKYTYTGRDIPTQYNKMLASLLEEIPLSLVPTTEIVTNVLPQFWYDTDLQEMSNAVILVQTQINGGIKFGSGFLLTSTGYAITCNHLVASAQKIIARIRIPGRIGSENSWHEVRIVKVDEAADLALLKLDGVNFPAMAIASAELQLNPGAEIALLGYPFGAKLSDNIDHLVPSIFEGKISSKQVRDGREQYFVDMQAKRGNSGGPVIDRRTGLVVGVLCGSQLEGTSHFVEEINYIRPVKYIWEEFVKK